MAENSKIEWTDHTFNPWRGCVKVSPACKNCYADALSKRNPKTLGVFGTQKQGGTRVVGTEAYWKKPLKWNLDYEEAMSQFRGGFGEFPERPRVFCASLADVFEDWVGPMVNHKGEKLFVHRDGSWSSQQRSAPSSPPRSSLTMSDVRRRLFALIDATPNLDWLVLSKRPENIIKFWGHPPGTPSNIPEDTDLTKISPLKLGYRPNVWIGTTVENQEQAEKRTPKLLKCRDLSPCLFLSCEPLLSDLDLQNMDDGESIYDALTGEFEWHNGKEVGIQESIDWLIVGGESGPNARPSHPDWYRSLRGQCEAAGVPFFFKQWGEWASVSEVEGAGVHHSFEDGATVRRVGKKKAGRLLDGVEHNGFPEVKFGGVK